MTSWTYSSAFAEPAGSPIRELFPYLSRPGMISFAGGYPSPTLFDAEGLREASVVALRTPASALQYGATEGSPQLRNALQAHVRGRGIDCGPADILVTTGSQQAFDLLVRVLVSPGDTVLLETPAYPASLQALRLAQARIVPVPADNEGVQVDALEAILAALPREQKPKFLYTVPNFSNPAGSLLSPARRQALVSLAMRHGLCIVEDDPYGALSFNGNAPGTLFALGRALAGEQNPVVYLSSLSKTVAPALRIGWMIAPAALNRRCAIAKQTADLCTSPLSQAIAGAYLDSGRYLQAVGNMCAEYRKRMRCMASALQECLEDRIAFEAPCGGMFMWLELRSSVRPRRLFEAAVEAGVLFVPGAAFYPSADEAPALRLSFAGPDCAQIEQGVDRLRQAFEAARH